MGWSEAAICGGEFSSRTDSAPVKADMHRQNDADKTLYLTELSKIILATYSKP